MTTLETADGRLLRSQRPAGGGYTTGAFSGGLWSGGLSGSADADGYLKSFEAIYRSQPVIASVIDRLTRRASTLPFDAYRELPDGAREVVRGDTLDTLIRRPQPRRSTVHLNAHVMQSMLIHGNALLAKVRGTDPEAPPTMLWPLDWAHVSAWSLPGGTIEWWSTTQFGFQQQFIDAKDVIHFAWPSPAGGEIGVSPLEKLGVTIRLDDAVARHQTAMFRNGSRPSLAVSINDPGLKREELEYARERVEMMHRGVDQAGGTFFMGANVKVEPLSLSPVEVALIDQRRLNLQEIGMVFDLAGPLMGDMTHGTYNNVEELLRSLYRDVVPPWLALMEGTYQAQLIDPEPAWIGRFAAFDLSDKLKGDPIELANTLKLEVEAGLITRNEARRILNLPPVADPEADKLFMNANNQAPIDFHRNNEVLTESPGGTEVNPPAGPPASGTTSA